MVAVGFVCIALAFGASTATMPLIYGPVIDELGWSRTATTLLFTFKNTASAVIALLLGPLLLRFGLRAVMIAALVVTAAGMLAFLGVRSLASYYAAGVLLGCGVASVMIAVNVLVSRWFIRNQGFAIGITLAGTSAGGLVFPLLATELIELYGWRQALAALSLSIWAIALPLYLWKARETPRHDELLVEAGDAPRPLASLDDGQPSAPLRRATFWVVAVCLMTAAAADAGVFQHTALLIEREAGMTSGHAAGSLAAIFGLGVVAKIAAGRVYDVWSVRGAAAWYLLLALSILTALPLGGLPTLLLFTALRGIAHGGLVPQAAVLAKHCYGPRNVDVTLPTLTGFWAIGAGLGPVILASLYDATGHYRLGLLLFFVASVAAAIALHRVSQRGQSLAPGRLVSARP
ncbi:MAG TPA: MFS transporter [Gammaproteobacteria bacterium]